MRYTDPNTPSIYIPLSEVHNQYLIYQHPEIVEFIASLSENITFLKIEYETIPIFPSLSRFKKLKTLSLFGCRIQSMTDDLSDCESLIELDLSRNGLITIPDLRRLTQLKTIRFSANQLTSMPLMPVSIRHIHADYNDIKDLSSLTHLPNIEVIYISDNEVEAIPPLSSRRIRILEAQNNPRLSKMGNVYCDDENDVWGKFDLTNTLIHKLAKQLNIDKVFDPTIPRFNQMEFRITEWGINQYLMIGQGTNLFVKATLQMLEHQRRLNYTFYLAKCRRRLRHWLYTRVLEPLMERKYHPQKLINYVHANPLVQDVDQISSDAFLDK